MLGFVYFVSNGREMKIGFSANPATRLKELQTASSSPLLFLGAIPGDLATEKALHRRYARFRAHGEWFRLDPDLLQGIGDLLDMFPTFGRQVDPAHQDASRAEEPSADKTHDGLSRRAYQARELSRFIRETWPNESARAAAASLGEPLQTIRNWMDETTFPGGFKLLNLLRRFGLELLIRLEPEPTQELRTAVTALRRRAVEAEIARLNALLSGPELPASAASDTANSPV